MNRGTFDVKEAVLISFEKLICACARHEGLWRSGSIASLLNLVEDIPLCLSIILKWNKIYTSSNTTILEDYFFNQL